MAGSRRVGEAGGLMVPGAPGIAGRAFIEIGQRVNVLAPEERRGLDEQISEGARLSIKAWLMRLRRACGEDNEDLRELLKGTFPGWTEARLDLKVYKMQESARRNMTLDQLSRSWVTALEALQALRGSPSLSMHIDPAEMPDLVQNLRRVVGFLEEHPAGTEMGDHMRGAVQGMLTGEGARVEAVEPIRDTLKEPGAEKKRRGRPRGSKNKAKAVAEPEILGPSEYVEKWAPPVDPSEVGAEWPMDALKKAEGDAS